MKSLIFYILFFQSCASDTTAEYYFKQRFEEAAKKHLSGDYKGAIIVYEEILKNNPPVILKENVLLNLADVYLATGNHEQSLKIFYELLKNTKNPAVSGACFFKLANFYLSVNDFTLARKYIIEALKYPPQYYSLYLALQMAAKVCYMVGDIENAKYYFSKLFIHFPEDPYAQKVNAIGELLMQGNFYLQLGRFSSVQNAKNLVTKLSILGYPVFAKNVTINNNNFHLVLCECKTQESYRKIKEVLSKLDIDAIEIP